MSLAVILDQNIPHHVAEYLRSKRPNWNVSHVRDIGLSGASDPIIFELAQQNDAIVITFDENFADTRMYPAGSHAGVIRLRVWPTTIEHFYGASTTRTDGGFLYAMADCQKRTR